MTALHIKYVSFQNFSERIQQLKCPKNIENLTNLCCLYGLTCLKNDPVSLYESGLIPSTSNFSKALNSAINGILADLRPQILSIIENGPLTDDEHMMSAIGNQYGDIYETHLDWAMNSKLNTQTEDAIPPGYMKYVKPVMNWRAKM